MFHRLLTLLFPLFHSTNGVPRRSLSQLFLLFTRFHDAPLVDLLPSHRRVPRKSHWFGSSSTRQDFIDSIATEQSVPPSLLRITFTRNFVLPGKFSDYHRGCLFYFVSLSSFFFPPQVLPSSLSYLFFFSWATLLTLRFLRFRSLVYTFFEVSPPPIEWSSRVRPPPPPPPPWIIFSCSSFFVLVVRSL